ncbi:MAG: TraI domain-containing protein [Burkholderiales bacterium]|nr:TraI domain-containing protein [Burkholderiales bacterium]
MVSGVAASMDGAAGFASADPGFDVLPVEALLAPHEALLGRIKLCYGADRATFERDLMPLARSYAAFVHLLPATPDNYFKTPGGLLRLGLETAFFALQGTDAHIFSSKATISARRELEPRWRTATFVGGLCCEVHRVLSHLIVTTPEGDEWPSFLMPLCDWLQQHRALRYFIRWRPRASEVRGLGLYALPMIVPPTLLEALRHDDGAIVRQLFASVGGVPQYREHNVLDDLVRRSLALVIDRNLLASADRYGSPQYGSHLERYLVDAMRRLAASHSAWTVNRDKGRLWFGEDGLFLVWPAAAQDMLAMLEADQLAGIPKAPDTLLDILLDAGVLLAQADGSRTWKVFPSDAPLEAVKLSAPAILLAGIEPAPVALARPVQRHERELVAQVPAPPPKPWREATKRPESPPASSPQLSLIEVDDADAAVQEEVSGPSTHAAALPEGPVDARPIRLRAPMRLNPAVRQSLHEAIDALNDPPATTPVFTVREGVFVPLTEFERRSIQPAVAVRSLNDVGMLHKPSQAGPPTLSRDVQGVPAVGVVILAAHVEGLDPEAFISESGTTTPGA